MNTIGGTFILNQVTEQIASPAILYATYNTTIILGNFTPLFTVPSNEKWEIVKIGWTGPGRITLGATPTNFFFQDSTAQTLNTFNQTDGNRIVFPPGTSGWIDNRGGPVTTVFLNGIKIRSI